MTLPSAPDKSLVYPPLIAAAELKNAQPSPEGSQSPMVGGPMQFSAMTSSSVPVEPDASQPPVTEETVKTTQPSSEGLQPLTIGGFVNFFQPPATPEAADLLTATKYRKNSL